MIGTAVRSLEPVRDLRGQIGLPSSVFKNLEPGDVLEQAMIGPPVGGLIDLLIGTRHVLWQPDDPEGLGELVGFGLVARTSRERDRYREVVMVSPDRSSILVMPRLTMADGSHDVRETRARSSRRRTSGSTF